MQTISYESISEKLGFRPFIDEYDILCPGHEDDTWVSPFSILSDEEKDYLFEYYMTHVKTVA